MNFSSYANFVFSSMRVTGSTVAGRYSAVLVGGDGIVGSITPESEFTPPERLPNEQSADYNARLNDAYNAFSRGEQTVDSEAYVGAPGIVFRPRPPDKTGDQLAAEAMAARIDGQLVPLAWRDLRINAKFPAPKAGTMAFVGYGGGFLSFDDTPAKTSLATLYVPFDYDSNGVPQKAHVVTLDPTAGNESINIVHASGAAVLINKDGHVIVKSASGDAYAEIADGEITLNGAAVNVNGGMAVGGAGGLDLTKIDALLTYGAAVQAALAAIGSALPPGAAATAAATAITAAGTALATLGTAGRTTRLKAV